jgi:hypothetical protein
MKLSEILFLLRQIRKASRRKRKVRDRRETGFEHVPWGTQIVGYGIGPKVRDGKVVEDHALRIYVRRKLAPTRLLKSELIPKRVRVRSLNRYLPTDVIEQPLPFQAQGAVGPSSQACHVAGPPGVISLGVLSATDNSPVLLSCAHVFAPRDHMNLPVDAIESPPAPGSTVANRIGVLKSSVPFTTVSTVDAATCEPDAGVTFPIAQVDGVAITGLWNPATDTSALTGRQVWRLDQNQKRVDGEIIAVDSQDVDLLDGLAVVHFEGVIRYRAPNQGGDSGGAVIDTLTNQLMGIHFAGNGAEGLFCVALSCFNALSVKLA